ncbi:MAG: carbamoyl-phosphate synthase large subunit [Deltaproteobacteria bacterium]|nr:carbamoyl-phosphate synthase large subunit [Deltaproteobacteria bacterium]
MGKRTDINSILVIGSGPIIIGQACEFDYSGTQAIKALKEEGYRVILVNSNPATIMTDPNLADATYIEPITCDFVGKIIHKERPDALLPTIGGQTGLNIALQLAEAGILEKYNVQLIGASIEAIQKAEDREHFKQCVSACGLHSARSMIARTVSEAKAAKDLVGFPLIIRPSRTLGGSGGAIVNDPENFEEHLSWGFSESPINEVLIEESLIGWKEIELEVMRDCAGNGVIICGIENVDPMGVHTGDSVTVAPIQTLTDKEYQFLRDSALKLMNEIGVNTGGCNVQFAICPEDGRQIVIEVNPRVSRSSALASKATGFPIAKIAAKLAIGYTLAELPNDITKKTPACFEPSIDYVVVKIPRFTFEKFSGADTTLGTQMKSIGETMAIGSTFCEALQKACRSLETDRDGLLGSTEEKILDLEEINNNISTRTPNRLFLITRALSLGASVEQCALATGYDRWFCSQMMLIVSMEKVLARLKLSELSSSILFEAKKLGFSDSRIAKILNTTANEIRELRRCYSLIPQYKKVDTCAAEFISETPYLYSTYQNSSDDIPSDKKKIVIIGGGPNRIGQGLEFDYCCVHAAFALKEAGYETIIINCNPETVSTDYDTSDKLYFEPLTLEDVLAIVERESPYGVIVQYGGQTPLKLSQALKASGVPIIGTSPEAIEKAEDRELFKKLLDYLELKQPKSGLARSEVEALAVTRQLGYPVMVRPSFVLGGRAMAIISNDSELRSYINESVSVSFKRPVLIDRFLDHAIEIDVDALCDGRDVLVAGVIEHVEHAGIHSGDSTFMFPAQTLSDDVIDEIELATRSLARTIGVIGLMNIQFAVAQGSVFVLEVNPRASRSVPFVSKVTGIPWAKVAARVMAGESLIELDRLGCYGNILKFRDYRKSISSIPFVAVKEVVFPFKKFRGFDAVLGPEMRSTGEVMGLDSKVSLSFYRAQVAAGCELTSAGACFVSLKDGDKDDSLDLAYKLIRMGYEIWSTEGTANFFNAHGISARRINKVNEGSPHVVDKLKDHTIKFVINTPKGSGSHRDSRLIRTTAVEMDIPLYTTVAAASALVDALAQIRSLATIEVKSIQEYLRMIE